MHQQEGGQADRITCAVEAAQSGRIQLQLAAIGAAVSRAIGLAPPHGEKLGVCQWPVIADAAHGLVNDGGAVDVDGDRVHVSGFRVEDSGCGMSGSLSILFSYSKG